MKNVDPLLLILTVFVGLGLLTVLGRFAATGELSEGLLTVMATMLGTLVTAITTSRKKKDEEDEDDS